jgi:hypothetical protein
VCDSYAYQNAFTHAYADTDTNAYQNSHAYNKSCDDDQDSHANATGNGDEHANAYGICVEFL